MVEKYFPIILFSIMILLFVNLYRNYLKLRALLFKHNKPVSSILLSWGINRDFKQAEILIKELKNLPEEKDVKKSLRKTAIAFYMIPLIFFTSVAIFFYFAK